MTVSELIGMLQTAEDQSADVYMETYDGLYAPVKIERRNNEYWLHGTYVEGGNEDN